MANKIGAVLAHLTAIGIMVSGCWVHDDLGFIQTILFAIFAELMAIYFNTNK